MLFNDRSEIDLERGKNKIQVTVAPKKVTQKRDAKIWEYMELIRDEVIDAIDFIKELSEANNDDDPFFELIDVGKLNNNKYFLTMKIKLIFLLNFQHL